MRRRLRADRARVVVRPRAGRPRRASARRRGGLRDRAGRPRRRRAGRRGDRARLQAPGRPRRLASGATSQLQVALYLLAVRELLDLEPVAGLYQPLSGASSAPAGSCATTCPAATRAPTSSTTAAFGRRCSRPGAGGADRADLHAGRLAPCPERCSSRGCRYPGICRGGEPTREVPCEGHARAARGDRRSRPVVLLAAGAGSGKTAVMVERFAEAVLHDGVRGRLDPDADLHREGGRRAARAHPAPLHRARRGRAGARGRRPPGSGRSTASAPGSCGASRSPRASTRAFVVLDEAAARRARVGRVSTRRWETWMSAQGRAGGRPRRRLRWGILETTMANAHAALRSRGATRPRLTIPPAAPPPDPGPLAPPRWRRRPRCAARRGRASSPRATPSRPASGSSARPPRRRPRLRPPRRRCPTPWTPRSSPPARGRWSTTTASRTAPAWSGVPGGLRGPPRAAGPGAARRAARRLQHGLRRGQGGAGGRRLRRPPSCACATCWRATPRCASAGPSASRSSWSTSSRTRTGCSSTLLERAARATDLFAVGDESQSIYGFRHADVSIFRARRAALGPARVRGLTVNFRSRPEILDVVNAAFGPVLGAGFTPLVSGRAPEELRLFAPGPPEEPRVELLAVETAGWEDREPELGLAALATQPWRRAEARAVAARLRAEVDAGRPQRDAVVLVRATSSLGSTSRRWRSRGSAPTWSAAAATGARSRSRRHRATCRCWRTRTRRRRSTPRSRRRSAASAPTP